MFWCKQEVLINRRTGGVCLAISSKAMRITGIDDRRYWNHIPTDQSRLVFVFFPNKLSFCAKCLIVDELHSTVEVQLLGWL